MSSVRVIIILFIGLILSCLRFNTISGFVVYNVGLYNVRIRVNNNNNNNIRVSILHNKVHKLRPKLSNNILTTTLYGNKKNSIDFCLLPEDSSLSATKYITKSQTRTLNSHTNAALRRIIVERSWASSPQMRTFLLSPPSSG